MRPHTPKRVNCASIHHDEILQMRLEGKSASIIAAQLDLTTTAVNTYAYRNNMPKAADYTRLLGALMPNQRALLAAYRDKWECTDAQAIVEILRDWIDEQAQRQAAE